MIRALYNGTTGMNASQEALSTVSNNIANSQTVAFKTQKVEFEEVFYQQLKSPSSPGKELSGVNPADVGNGVRVSTISSDFSQGSITYTGGKTDAAIEGDGFFIVGNINGQDQKYTKAGNFDVSQHNELVTKTGHYVLGWNMDPITGEIATGANLEPLRIPIGEVGDPKETTMAQFSGNLDRSAENGTSYGIQLKTYDRLGVQHDVDLNFIKTANNTYRYIAVPKDQFKGSASIEKAILRPNEGIANSILKGDYEINVTPSGTPGMSEITVLDPTGATVLTQTITDVDQTVTLNDGTNNWITVQYKGGQGTTSATLTIGESGDIQFDSVGNIANMTGSGPGGSPQVEYTPEGTGQSVVISVNFDNITSLAADSGVKLDRTDGYTSSTLVNFSLSDGGVLQGYYSDGSVRPIGQMASATFPNIAGLTREGSGFYVPTPNSGIPDIGVPGTGSRSNIKAQAVEASNVDLASEFVNMISVQKLFQANTKVITAAQQILDNVIQLVR